MSETTVICTSKECGKRVPRKPFCFECGASLVIVTQPTTSEQSKVSTLVKGTDSATGGQGIDAPKAPERKPHAQTLPTITTPTQTANQTPAKTSVAPSYAEATQSKPPDEGRPGNRQGSSANNEQTGLPTESSEKLSVKVSRNDGTAANVDIEATKKVC